MSTETRKSHIWADALVLLTLGTLAVAGFLLWGAGFLRPGGTFPNLDELDRIGGFVGGLLAPVVLAWAARGYYLQRKQLIETITAMKEQSEHQAEANALHRREMDTAERLRAEQAASDTLRAAPRFTIQADGVTTSQNGVRHALVIGNTGATAFGFNLRIRANNHTPGAKTWSQTFPVNSTLQQGAEHRIEVTLPESAATLAPQGFTIEMAGYRADGGMAYHYFMAPQNLSRFNLLQFDPLYVDDEEG